MDNQYMTFWQNAFSDMIEKSSQFSNLDKIVEQSLLNIEEFTSMFKKMSRWGIFLKPVESQGMFDFKKSMDGYFKILGLISIEEYRSLVTKYEELKKEHEKLDKLNDEQKKKITELNQSASSEKKKMTAQSKNNEDNKTKLDDQKKLTEKLTKDLSSEKKHSASLEKELSTLKQLNETLTKNQTKKPEK